MPNPHPSLQGSSIWSREREVWPRWLPGTNLRDRHTHLARSPRDSAGVCGFPVMWAREGHPSSTRPRCPECRSASGG